MSKTYAPLVCQACNGTGKHTYDQDRWNNRAQSHYTVKVHEDCEDCKGTGDQACSFCVKPATDTFYEHPICEECLNQGYRGECSYCGEPARYVIGLVNVCDACKSDFDDERDKRDASEY